MMAAGRHRHELVVGILDPSANAYGGFRSRGLCCIDGTVRSAYALLSDVAGTAVSNAGCATIGYRVDDRVYASVYDTAYTLNNPTVATKHGVTLSVPGLPAGTYVLIFTDTFTGAIVAQTNVVVDVSGLLIATLPDFSADLAVAATRMGG